MVSVSDDGCGIDLEQVRKRAGKRTCSCVRSTPIPIRRFWNSVFCLVFSTRDQPTSTREEAWGSTWCVRWWRRSAATFIWRAREGRKQVYHASASDSYHHRDIRFQTGTGSLRFRTPGCSVCQLPAAGAGTGDPGGQRVLDQRGAVYSRHFLHRFYHIPGTPRTGTEIMAYVRGSTRTLYRG